MSVGKLSIKNQAFHSQEHRTCKIYFQLLNDGKGSKILRYKFDYLCLQLDYQHCD